jgi:hypothetical protein
MRRACRQPAFAGDDDREGGAFVRNEAALIQFSNNRDAQVLRSSLRANGSRECAPAFVFGIASFANVPPMQMRVMKYGKAAPELAATANISAFNIANALGGLIGGAIVDSSFGAGAIPFAAAIVPFAALLFILSQERRSADPVLSREPGRADRAGSLKSLGEEQLSPSYC